MTQDPTRAYRPAGTLVAAITAFFALYLLLSCVASWSTWLEIDLLTAAQRGMEITEDQVLLNDARQGLIGLGQFGLFLVLAVLFCVWVYRANKNARALGATDMDFTPGWCVGWFFIPIMNLYKPYQAVKEIWQASDPEVPGGAGSASVTLGLWWLLWIVGGVLGQASFRLSMRAETLDEYITAAYATLASDAVDIPVTILALLLVRGIHGRQERKHLASAPAPPMEESAPWMPPTAPPTG